MKEVFEAALDREPSARHAFRAVACRGPAQLRREVDARLERHRHAGSLRQPPALRPEEGRLGTEVPIRTKTPSLSRC